MKRTSAILKFPRTLVDEPVMARVMREHDVEVNILQASITPEEAGRMFVFFSGAPGAVRGAIGALEERAVRVVLPARNIVRDEELCVHCGACVGQCPSGAFEVDRASGRVSLVGERCIACELCLPACSYGALESLDDRLVAEQEG